MIFTKIGLNNVYLVAAVGDYGSRQYYCRYAEFVGHKKDILSVLNREHEIKHSYRSFIFPTIKESSGVFVTKLPSGLFHYGIIGSANLLLSSKSSDNIPAIPMVQLFNYLDKKSDIPLLLNWMPYIADEMVLDKKIGSVTYNLGGVYGWSIWGINPEKLSVSIEEGLKKGKISASSKSITDNEYPIPDYAIDKKDLAGLTKKDKLALKEIVTDGLWTKGMIQEHLMKPAVNIPAPAMPLRTGHIGLIFASGNLNNALLENEHEKVLIKYSAEKILADKTQEKDKEIKREYLRSVIKYVDFNDNLIKTIQSDRV
ncbi:MAG: hypothetical protein WC976_06425 [Caldisericia bacterium]